MVRRSSGSRQPDKTCYSEIIRFFVRMMSRENSFYEIALLSLLIAIVLIPGLACADSNLLFPPELFPIGSQPLAAAIGDVNNDGRNDVVLVSGYKSRPDTDHHVHVLLQNDRGQLAAPVKYPTSASYASPPVSVAIGDVNNDGRSDVVVGMTAEGLPGELQSHIDVLLQNASGGLDAAETYTSRNGSIIKIGDFNGDGLLDVVGKSLKSGSVDVLLQNHNGTLEPPVAYQLVTDIYNGIIFKIGELSIGDLNNDGLTDIVVLTGPNIEVLLQQESGTLAPPVVYALNSTGEAYWIDVGDINGDGLQDVAISRGKDILEGKTVGILLQNGMGTLDPMISYGPSGQSEYVHIADMNNDGRLDLIAQYGWYFGIFLQGSDGTLMPEELYYAPNGLHPLSGDVNSDGLNDIVMHCYIGISDGAFVLYHRKYGAEINVLPDPLNYRDIPIGSSAAQTIVIYNTGTADLNLNTISISGQDSAQFISQNDTCTGQNLPPLYGCAIDIVFLPSSKGAKRAALEISSNDNDNEILSIGLYGNLAYAALFRAPYTRFLIGKGYGWEEAVAVGDVNSDGRNDAVLVASGASGSLHIFLQNSSGGLQPPIMYLTGGDATTVDIGDVNNDGKNDIVVGNGQSIMVYLQHFPEGFEPPMLYMVANRQLKIGDFNGDGRLDVASLPWGSQPDGAHPYVDILLQNQHGILDPPVKYYIPHGGYDEITAGDVNNDGLTDIIVMSGQGWIPNVSVLMQKTGGSLSDPIYYDFGTYELSKGIAAGDINGDAMTDFVVTNGEDPPYARIAVFSPASESFLPWMSLSSDYYGPPIKVAIADINLDGKNDIAVVHYMTAVGVYLQDTDGTFLPEELYETSSYSFSQYNRSFAAGDINGDGLNDLLIANYGLIVHYHANDGLPMRLLAPNGGENITTGSVYTIQWTGPAYIKKYSLKYSLDNGVTWKMIKQNIAGTSYNWHVLARGGNKRDCLVKVIGYDANDRAVGSDRSDSTFTIEEVRVASPNGMEVWTSGENRTITWVTNETVNPVAKVKLFYTKNNGGTWHQIATITGNNPGTYNWRVPDVLKKKENCRIKVLLKDAMGNFIGSDASDLVFAIQPAS